MSFLPPNPSSWSAELGGVEVRFGAGRLEELGEEVRRLGGRRPLVVTDPGIVAAGLAERAIASLARAGLTTGVFDGVGENPTTEHVARGVEAARAHATDFLVGLGGGSSMDCARGMNLLLSNGGRLEDYWGDGLATGPFLPSIGVATTAGTGSEAQRFALISQAESHRKMACGARGARFRTVFLDPELLATLPARVAALTGLDALTHAVESYVTRRRNPVSQLYAREAWRLLDSSFETFLGDRTDTAVGARMLLGAHLAGAAIEASMLGAAHSCANPLTAHFDVPHGAAVGLLLPHVVRFNGDNGNPSDTGEQIEALYADLVGSGNGTARSATERLSDRTAGHLARAGLAPRLRDWGVEEGRLDQLAEEAAAQWTAQFNPRPVSAGDLRGLYASAF